MVRIEVLSNSEEETEQCGLQLCQKLPPNTVVCLFGDLAAGKTTFVRGMAPDTHVSSPTFTFLNIYPAEKPIYHFDLYRLNDPEEFFHMGFEEFFTANGICCIEWSERIASLLPRQYVKVTLSHVSENVRKISIYDEF